MKANVTPRWEANEASLLGAWCVSLGIHLDERQREQLAIYRALLLDWNRRMNLTAIVDPQEVLVKHFLDSLTLAPHLRDSEHLVDVGSGAGFPGLVLTCARPDLDVTLIESRAKKVGFLEHVRRTLNLKRCRILYHRLGEKDPALAGTFSLVVFRAVRSLLAMIKLVGPYVCLEGRAIAMLGQTAAVNEATLRESVRGLGWELLSVKPYTLPQGARQRQLAFLRKAGPERST
jgi:16S rRNA (guanine527-N7)-methyltransferase